MENISIDNFNVKHKQFTLFSKKFNNMDKIIQYFNENFYTMVSINKTTFECDFTIDNNYIGSFNEDKNKYYIGNILNNEQYIIKDNNYMIIKKNLYRDNNILIPTYDKHIEYAILLIESIYKFVNDIDNVIINILVSSINEIKNIIEKLNNCKEIKTHNINFLVYDYVCNEKNYKSYQTFKKFWGLLTLNYKYCMVLDSDFRYFNYTNINEDINLYKNKIFLNNIGSVSSDKLGNFPVDNAVLKNVNNILNTEYNFFPLELPWIYEKDNIELLNSKINLQELSKPSKNVIFEIILYRLFILKYKPNNYEKIELYNEGFTFDFNINSIDLINHHYAISAYNTKNKSTATKMLVHTDRMFLEKNFNKIPTKYYLGIGSCRILTPLFYLNNANRVIYNSLINWYERKAFIGNHFMGKLHNTKEIIQFIKLIKGDINLSDKVMKLFLTSFSISIFHKNVPREKNPENALKRIINQFKKNYLSIEKIFIEISSLKIYKYCDNYVMLEHISHKNPYINDYKSLMYKQDENELINDLELIVDLLGSTKIVFVSHINYPALNNRLIIKKSLEFICNKYNIPLILPYEEVLNKNNKLLQKDLLHYTIEGIDKIKDKLEEYM